MWRCAAGRRTRAVPVASTATTTSGVSGGMTRRGSYISACSATGGWPPGRSRTGTAISTAGAPSATTATTTAKALAPAISSTRHRTGGRFPTETGCRVGLPAVPSARMCSDRRSDDRRRQPAEDRGPDPERGGAGGQTGRAAERRGQPAEDRVPAPERVVVVVRRGVAARLAARPGQHLPGGPAGDQQVGGQVGIELGQARQPARGQALGHAGVEGGSPG